jgi:hypothetical protein
MKGKPMGQYHHPVCIEAEEGLDPAGMDSGLKEGEQGFNRPSTPNALVALVCARGGNMPADCSQSPLIGRWPASASWSKATMPGTMISRAGKARSFRSSTAQ